MATTVLTYAQLEGHVPNRRIPVFRQAWLPLPGHRQRALIQHAKSPIACRRPHIEDEVTRLRCDAYEAGLPHKPESSTYWVHHETPIGELHFTREMRLPAKDDRRIDAGKSIFHVRARGNTTALQFDGFQEIGEITRQSAVKKENSVTEHKLLGNVPDLDHLLGG